MSHLLQTIEAKVKSVLPFLSPQAQEKIQQRIASIQKALPALEVQAESAPLPPLVMKMKGLPVPLDPFYFTLTKDPYAQ